MTNSETIPTGPALSLSDKAKIIIFLGFLAYMFAYSTLIIEGGLFFKATDFVVFYLMYAIGLLVMLHIGFISFPRMYRYDLWKLTPKIFDYIYLVILSLGLAQIYVEAPKFPEFATVFFGGNTEQILAKMVKTSNEELTNCTMPDVEFYTIEYCEYLRQLAATGVTEEDALRIDREKDFHGHIIKRRPYTFFEKLMIEDRYPDEQVPTNSPIPGMISNLRAVKEYGNGQNIDTGNFDRNLRWIAIFLLPLGIALRITKTSIEIAAAIRPSNKKTVAGDVGLTKAK
jgi:hypothetical protein